MEKRVKRSRTLHGLLLGYLLHTGLACAAAAVLWFGAILAVIETGFVLPAYSGSTQRCGPWRSCPRCRRSILTQARCRSSARWVVLDTAVAPGGDAAPENVLATNMGQPQPGTGAGAGHAAALHPVLPGRAADRRHALPFAVRFRPPLRRPGAARRPCRIFQSCMTVILFLLLAGVVFTTTRRTARRLRAITGRLTDACRLLAGGDLGSPHAPPPPMCGNLTRRCRPWTACAGKLAGSLKAQWAMEQQRAQRMAALTHDLKTPLTIIQGNAELLAEEELSAGQRPLVEAILRGAGRAGQYLAALRDVCTPQPAPAASEEFPLRPFCEKLAATRRSPLHAPRGAVRLGGPLARGMHTAGPAAGPGPRCGEPAGQRRPLCAPGRAGHAGLPRGGRADPFYRGG